MRDQAIFAWSYFDGEKENCNLKQKYLLDKIIFYLYYIMRYDEIRHNGKGLKSRSWSRID